MYSLSLYGLLTGDIIPKGNEQNVKLMNKCKAGFKKALSDENIKSFLLPRKITIALFFIIIAVHFALNLGLGFFPMYYAVFVSLLYGGFNLPLMFFLFILDLPTLTDLDVLIPLSFIQLLLPLVLHLIYWYVVASFASSVVRQRNPAIKYRNAFVLLAAFFAFFIIAWFLIAVFVTSA